MTKLKSTRTVTYRKAGVPALILEGKWLEKIFGLKIGDKVNVEYHPHAIVLRNINAEVASDLALAKSN